MNGVSKASVLLRALVLGACLIGAGSCGPNSDNTSVEVFFYLDTDSETDITRLEFVAIPSAGNFSGGSDACTVASGIVTASTDATVVVRNGQLEVDLENVRRIGPGAIVVQCDFDEGGVTAEISVRTVACTYDINQVSDAPDLDCPVAFTLESVVSCGDGVQQGSEECDDGADNSNTVKDACRENCLDAYCGDGVTDSGEECDDNGVSTTCSADCQTITPGS